MPLLMCVSGYLFLSSRVKESPSMKLWWHKSQPLIIPFISMGFFLYVLRDYKGSYWYLRTLFEYITIQLTYEICRNKFCLGLGADIVFFLISWGGMIILGRFLCLSYLDGIIDFSHLQWLWIYFYSGVLFRRYGLLFKLKQIKNIESYLLIIFASYSFITIGYQNEISIFTNTFTTPLYILCGLISIFLGFEHYKQSIWIMKAFQYMGRHTLEIYLIHVLIPLKLCSVGELIIKLCKLSEKTGDMQYQLTGLTIEILMSVLLSLIIIFLCASIYEPLKVYPLVYRILFGRRI